MEWNIDFCVHSRCSGFFRDAVWLSATKFYGVTVGSSAAEQHQSIRQHSIISLKFINGNVWCDSVSFTWSRCSVEPEAKILPSLRRLYCFFFFSPKLREPNAIRVKKISLMEPFLEEFPWEFTWIFCLPAEDTSVCPSLPQERAGALLKDFHLCSPQVSTLSPVGANSVQAERRALLQKLVEKTYRVKTRQKKNRGNLRSTGIKLWWDKL